ncbi:MAG: hypothetical protein DMG84_22055 [Acidobacteria bacterium]|nr:MAG: hypothetical protein DMG84_22055 [Acidobacteriota bacterium]
MRNLLLLNTFNRISRFLRNRIKAEELIDAGIFALEDVPEDIKFTDIQKAQLRAYRTAETIIDTRSIASQPGELRLGFCHFS